MEITRDYITALASWSDPKEIMTKMGLRMLRVASPPKNFWDIWRAHKEALKQFGLSCKKDDHTGQWSLAWWMPLDEAEVARRNEAAEMSRAASADVDLPAPDGLAYLPYQRAGIQYALARPSVLIADQMGMGKTVMALGIINADESLKRVLIICPASLKINWQREAEKWLVRPLSIGIATGKFWPDTDIVIANYDILTRHVTMPAEKRKEAVEPVGDWSESAIPGESVAPCTGAASAITWDACIVDEAHLMKNPKAQRTRAIKQIKARRHVRMTGTPICNRPVELFPIISDLHERWHNWFQFSKRYCNLSFNEQRVWDALAGHYVTKNIADASGASRLDELQMFLRQTIMVRRLKRDVLTELPPKLRQVIEIPATGDLAALINAEADFARESAEDIAAAHDAVELSKASADESDYTAAVARLREVTEIAFTSMSKMRHDIAVAKVPAMIAHLRDCMEADDRKVVFFAHHHDVIDAVMAAAEAEGWRPVRVTGVDSMQDRQDAVDAFQRDPGVRLFCGNIKAAGVGLTLTASSHVVFGELDWVPGNVSQAEDRCHRIGQSDSVLVQHLVVERSTDAKMAKAIVAKQAIIDKALDRDAMVLQSIPVPLSIESTPAPEGARAREGAREGAQGRAPTREQAPAHTRTHEERVEAATANHTRAALVEVAEKLTRPQIAAIGTAIRVLAGLDADFAQARNGEGFNKADGRIGHSLANLRNMTPMQAALASKLVRRYRRQLDGALLEACGI